MPTDDYYSLIGVDADANRDQIRDAYRARRAELGDDESGRATAARLNRAWNILSDPQQRAKYDDQLSAAREGGDEIIVPEVVDNASTNGSGNRARPPRSNNPRRQRQRVEMPDDLNGVALASVRDRTTALVIDGFICFLLLFMGTQLMFYVLANQQKPAVVDKIDQLKKVRDADQKVVDDAQKARDAIKDKNSADYKAADEKLTAVKKTLKSDDDVLNTENGKLRSVQIEAVIIAGAVTLAVFVIPTALTGRSPGKAIRKIKLVKDDAVTPVGWSTAFIHYGVTIGFLMVTLILIPLAAVVAVFGVSNYSRNPKRQGWDNRLSKTVVIAG
jgi:hypothetical protein